jgi:hypothetical protein
MNDGLFVRWGALTMKPSLALSRDVNVRHGSDRAYLAGEHGFDLSSHLTGRRRLPTRPSLLFVPTSKPSKPSTRMSPSLASPGSATACAPSPHLYCRCALVRKELQSLLADDNIELLSTWTGRAPAVPSLQSMPGASPRATASIRTDVDAEDTSGAAKLLLCKARASPNVTDVRLAVSDSGGYRSRAHISSAETSCPFRS